MYSVIPSKTLLVNHTVNENNSPLPPEKCWILKIRHWVGRIVPQGQVIEPISRDKSTLYRGRGRQRKKNSKIVLFVPTLLATIVAAPFVKAAMGHVTLFSCLWHLSLAVNHQLPGKPGQSIYMQRNSPDKPGSRLFTTELPVCRGKIFSHKHKSIIHR